MLKKIFLIVTCVLLVLVAFSQTKNRVSIFYSPANNGVDIKSGWTGDMGHTGKGANLFELRYSRNINSFFAVETGLQYAHNKIETHYFSDGVTHTENWEISMVSVPIYGNLTFLKYFFVEAGPMADIEFNMYDCQTIPSQSGIGFILSLGGKYTYKNITVVVNPFFQRHLMLSFGGEDSTAHLWESGIKFGLGYSF